MRRPTEINASKANGSQHTSSISTEDSTNSEEPEKHSEILSDSGSANGITSSADGSALINTQCRSEEAQTKRKIEEVIKAIIILGQDNKF